MKKNEIIKPEQAGFRNNRRTLDHLLRLTSDVETCINRKKINIAVALDLEKAFDTVHREGILVEMKKIGINGQMYNYVRSFLTNRTFQVRVEDTLSDIHVQENGTPQGAVLSPTLFNIAINTINTIKEKHTLVRSGLFADDNALWLKPEACVRARKTGIQKSRKIIENATNDLIKELQSKGFKVNTEKTQIIIFNKQNKNLELTEFKIDGKTIKPQNKIKYLGVTYNSQLKLKHHID